MYLFQLDKITLLTPTDVLISFKLLNLNNKSLGFRYIQHRMIR